MITILATVFVFGLLVFVHELGHFIVAKMSGMKVTEFALGFGPNIYQRKDGETLYSLRVIPLGGYNKIAGMDPDEPYDPRNFNNHSIFKRFLVIIAGSVMNLILPILLFFLVIIFSGIQTPLDLPILGNVMANRPAALAGLQANDTVLAVESKQVDTWVGLVEEIRVRANQPTKLLVKRGEKEFSVTVIPQLDEKSQRGVIGVMAKMQVQPVGVWQAMKMSVVQTYEVAKEMLAGLFSLITGSRQSADLAGPLGVAQMAGQVAQYGIIPLLSFAAFLSINLGLINLFPIPMLDGGHVVTLLVEAVRGKPLSAQSMQRIQMIGLFILLSLMIFATVKDLSRFSLF